MKFIHLNFTLFINKTVYTSQRGKKNLKSCNFHLQTLLVRSFKFRQTLTLVLGNVYTTQISTQEKTSFSML